MQEEKTTPPPTPTSSKCCISSQTPRHIGSHALGLICHIQLSAAEQMCGGQTAETLPPTGALLQEGDSLSAAAGLALPLVV